MNSLHRRMDRQIMVCDDAPKRGPVPQKEIPSWLWRSFIGQFGAAAFEAHLQVSKIFSCYIIKYKCVPWRAAHDERR